MIHYQYTIENNTITSLIKPEVGISYIEVEIHEPITAIEVPQIVENIQLRLALIEVGLMPSYVSEIIKSIPDEVERERLMTLFEYRDVIRRDNEDLIYLAKNKFGFTDEQLDNLFILANTK